MPVRYIPAEDVAREVAEANNNPNMKSWLLLYLRVIEEGGFRVVRVDSLSEIPRRPRAPRAIPRVLQEPEVPLDAPVDVTQMAREMVAEAIGMAERVANSPLVQRPDPELERLLDEEECLQRGHGTQQPIPDSARNCPNDFCPERPNVLFRYTYRDADNYKVDGSTVFRGPLTHDLKRRLLAAADHDSFNDPVFVPDQVGLIHPATTSTTFMQRFPDPRIDHGFVEFDNETWVLTTFDPPTDPRPFAQFVEVCEQVLLDGWDPDIAIDAAGGWR